MLTIIYAIYVFLALCAIALFIFCLYTAYAMLVAAPYLPTDKKNVAKMITIAKLKPGENLMDLGSGDGRILIAAAQTGAFCHGVEINPFLYWWSKIKVIFGRHKNIKISRRDLWNTYLYEVDVLTLFFVGFRMQKIKDKIKQEMKPGTRVVSYGFQFPDWEPVQKIDQVYLYIV